MSKILDSTGKAIPSKSIDIDDGDSVIIFKNNGNFELILPAHNNEGAITAMAISVLMRENNVDLQSLIVEKVLELCEDDKN